MKKQALLISFIFFATFICHGAVIRVPADQPAIQAGIDAAAHGDTILVAPGTYTGPGNRDITFSGKAIRLVSENGPADTIIDCEYTGRGVRFDSGESRISVIEGFTITRGSVVNDPDNNEGGCIFCSGSSPTISGCILSSGQAVEGAGFFSENGSPLIDSCIIENNLNASVGAGISIRGGAPWLVRSVIRGNSVTSGGDSVFGGGVFVLDSDATLTECIVSENTATDGTGSHSFGAGLYIQLAGYYRTTLTNCLIESNSALHVVSGNGGYGGGLFCGHGPVSVNSCTFTGNTAETNGGSIYAEGGSDVQLLHCISWGNTPEGVHGATSVRYSDIQGGYAGAGNIDADPLFTGGPDGNYYLSRIDSGQAADSPCIDEGAESSASTCYPIPDGERCMNDLTTYTDEVTDPGTLDLGFHYFPTLPDPTHTPEPTSTPTPTPMPWTGVRLSLSGDTFESGDTFDLEVACRGEAGDSDAELIVILDVYGAFMFWPSWTTEFQSESIQLQPDQPVMIDLLEFLWPSGDYGEADDLKFWAGICRPVTYDVIGDIDHVAFGYR